METQLTYGTRDKSGALFYIHYTGIIAITPELGAVFSASPDAKSTEFGDACKDILMLQRMLE